MGQGPLRDNCGIRGKGGLKLRGLGLELVRRMHLSIMVGNQVTIAVLKRG